MSAFPSWAPDELVAEYRRNSHPMLKVLLTDGSFEQFWKKVAESLERAKVSFPDGIPLVSEQIAIRRLLDGGNPWLTYWNAVRRAQQYEPMGHHTKRDRKEHLEDIRKHADYLFRKLTSSEYISTGRFRDAAELLEGAAPAIEDEMERVRCQRLAAALSKLTLEGVQIHLGGLIEYIDIVSQAGPMVTKQKDIGRARLIKFCRHMASAHRHHLFGQDSPHHDLIADLANALGIVPADYAREKGLSIYEVQSMTRGW